MAFDRQQQRVSIDEAISRFAGTQLASPNRYWVAFSLPNGISDGNVDGVSPAVRSGQPQQYSAELGDIGIMCSQMAFPSRSLMTVDSRHIATPFRLPYTAQYSDVTFTFYLSSDFRERKFFEIWQQSIINVHMNSLNFYKEYVRPVHLMQLDNQGNVKYQVSLIEAYPISVNEVVATAAAKDEVQQCSVTMAYRHWINPELV